MLKRLLIVLILVLTVTQVDAQKKYTRKVKIQTESDQNDEDNDENVDEEESDEVEVIEVVTYENEDDDSDEDEDEVIEEVDITINTKPIGKYLNERKKRSKAIEFEPLVTFGWNGIDLSSSEGNVLSGAKDFSDMNMKAFTSWNVGLYPLGIKINLYQQRFKLITGLGVQFFNYKFSDSVYFNPNTPYNVEYYNVSNFKKTKLGVSYLSAPLMLQYNSKKYNRVSNFSISGGLLFGYRLKTWTKYKLDNGTRINGTKSNYNFNNFVYSAVVAVGFRDVRLFATYMLTPMHRENTGFNVNAYPWSFGFML